MVFIASHWTAKSNLRVMVFTNCEEVELRLGGQQVARQAPERAWMTQHLVHPPVIFDLPAFEPGRLEAVGLVAGLTAARHVVDTPGEMTKLAVWVDEMGVMSTRDQPDLLFLHAALQDGQGTCCIDAQETVHFQIDGGVLIGTSEVRTEAGVASALLRIPAGVRRCRIQARVVGASWSSTHEIVRAEPLAPPSPEVPVTAEPVALTISPPAVH